MKRITLLLTMLFLVTFSWQSNAQYIDEDFEGGFLPTGWTSINNGSGNDWTENTSASFANSGTKSAKYSYDSANDADAWMFTSAVTLAANETVNWSFFTRSRGFTEKLKFTVGSSADVASQTTTLIDILDVDGSYGQQSGIFTATTAGDYYFAFNCYSAANQFELFVDDVLIETPPAYPPVNTLAELRAGVVGNPYEFTGEGFATAARLSASGDGSIRVFGQDDTAGMQFYAAAGVISASTINFGDGVTAVKGTLTEAFGTLVFVVEEDITLTGNNQPIIPEEVTAQGYVDNRENYESELIKIVNATIDPNGDSDFVLNSQYALTDPTGGNVTLGVIFPQLNGTIPTLANVTGIAVEYNTLPIILPRGDVDVEALTCSVASDLAAINITDMSADLGWTAGLASDTMWDVEWGAVGFVPGTGAELGSVADTTDNPYTATPLSGETTYEFYVRTTCISGEGEWVGPVSFTTLVTPPANDDCANAEVLTINTDYTCDIVTSGTIEGATDSGVSDNGSGTPNDDVWYSFVATEDTHTFKLLNRVGNTTDMVHEVMSGDCATLTSVNISDPEESIVSGLTVGDTYYLRVFSYFGPNKNTTFDVCVGTIPPPPANDDCANAEVLTINTDYTCDIVTSGTIAEATDSGVSDNGLGTPNDDVWFSFVATETTHTFKMVNKAGSYQDLVHEVMSGDCATLASVNVSDNDMSEVAGLTVGDTYYLRVFGYSSTAGRDTTFDVCVGILPPPPANDDACNAEMLTLNAAPTVGNNTLSTGQVDEPSPSCWTDSTVNSVWYSFVADANNITVTTDFDTPLNDTSIAVYSATDCADFTTYTEVGCDTDGGDAGIFGWNSVVDLTGLTDGETYYVQVEGYGSKTDEFNIQVIYTPPTNDNICDAIALTMDATSASDAYTNFAATGETDEPVGDCFSSGITGSVWFTFVAPASGGVNVTTNIPGGTNNDTEIAIYEAPTDCADATTMGALLGCGQDTDANYLSEAFIAPLVAGDTYYIQVDNWDGAFEGGTFGLEVHEVAIFNPIFDTNVIADCANSQFTVDLDVTSLGGAATVTVTDGTTTNANVGTGVITYGPYAEGTSVDFTVTSDDDVTYTSTETVHYTCPPVNDVIAGAIPITPQPEGTACDATTEFTARLQGDGATDSGLDGTCFGDFTGIDLFYTWTATTPGLLFSGGAGDPGVIIRDAVTGDEIACEGTFVTDVTLSGWAVGDDLIIQVYDFADSDSDVKFCLSELAIFNPEMMVTPIGDCANTQYSVDVDVTSLGGATSVTVSDDQGSATQTVSATGMLSFGPYAAGTPVVYTIVNDADTTYTSTANTVFNCPPANDNICDAIALTINATSTGDAYTNLGATGEVGEPEGSCFSNGIGGSVWFTFVAPASGNPLVITTDIAGGTNTDTEMAIYEAPTDCTDASTMGAEVGCDQDGGTVVNFNSVINLDTYVSGNTYYVQVDNWSGTFSGGTFGIEVQEITVSLPDCPTLVSPANGATNVTMRTDLVWEAATTGADPADSYDVYYGFGAGTPADTFWFNTTDTFVNGVLLLNFDSTVFNWKIVAKNAAGDSVGCTEFSFTTVAAADDYDGDGVINSVEVTGDATDTDMTDPCDPAQAAGYTGYDATNAIWMAADCDGDGQTNDFEASNGSDPYDANSTASVEELEAVGFEYYPNPVNSNLTVKANENITSIAIFNMLGQQVKQVNPSSLNAQIDMTNLANGTYFIKATVGERVGTFKIVKK